MNEWLISLSEYIGGMSDELDNANAKNAKLRELVEEDSEQLDKWQKKAEYYSQLSQLAEAENAKLRELLQRALTSHDKMCTNRGTCLGCLLFNAKPFAPVCPIVSVTRDARKLGIEADE